MKAATTALLCILIIFAPAASWAISIDATNAGVEVVAPNEVILHNLPKQWKEAIENLMKSRH